MTTLSDHPADLERFLRGQVAPSAFTHREHVRMAYELLRRHDFVETALHYSRALRSLVHRAGAPEKFNQTLTIAFLSLVAERLQNSDRRDFESFAEANPDLLDRSALGRLYSAERLWSEAARRTFLLPQALGSEAAPGLGCRAR